MIYQKIKQFLKIWPLFLFMLPFFFIYSGFNELFGFLTVKFILSNLFLTLVGTLIVLILALVVFRNKKKASVFTFLFCLLCLVFGYLHDSLKQINGFLFLTKFTTLLPIISLLVVFLIIYLFKRKAGFNELYLFLNLLFVILLLSEIPNSVKRYNLDKSVHNLIDFRFSAFHDYKPARQLPDSLKPDIYFLVFDAMASSKSLQADLGKNNFQLDSFLRRRGFFVATDSKANYNWTIHSLSSTFNMDYLPSWISPVMNDPKSYFWGSASILDNSLFSILKKEGYQTSSFQPISFNNTDWPGTPYFNSLKESHFYYKTLPGRVYRDIFWNYSKIDISFIKEQQMQIIDSRNREKKTFLDTTITLIKNSCSKTGRPKFIYGHFMLPHDPYTFDSTGKIKTAEEMIVVKKGNISDNYFNQVIFAGKVIKELVTYIQKHNKKNTIIIIEGDHGYRTEMGDRAGYSFQNLSSFYFPDQKYNLLYDSISPVNTFRVVLNKYFSARLPLLKDSTVLVTEKKETIRKNKKINQTL